ncbi:hypothetical protein BRYFOR_05437 [Marvinbryantia formatexigens DSM 14469]|uniref:Uncharacterized protein n=1 Tax=Marvinbryantia formatexigens DSM 14469 TaxID=478749 RepID=C6L9Z5_9FIRM|nr:hypothetical protein [Marvinbryantia formatexigens]EET62402.1 hypothetical protein BRYFOR_05437 [Marvinbryantia formatexigens DSM 14469]UWO25055.1 hypothetical protein NQ534_00720 [Marvinbryantia formatexigens DSM 14469]SDG28943.1 hypothetical protein SAMN05660368_02286 [Marvinbryantia formatexigens]
MIFGPMTEQQMTDYLKGMDGLKCRIAERRDRLYRQVETLEECIERNTFRHPEEGGTAAPPGGGDKLYRIWKKTRQDIEREIGDMAYQFMQLEQEEEKLAYVCRCLDMLYLPQRELIEELYIQGVSWTAFAREHCISIATLGRNRRNAMNSLLELYNFRFRERGEKDGKHSKAV